MYESQQQYNEAMRAWVADIQTWQKWAIEEQDPIMKEFYKRTLKRSMAQFLAELQSIYIETSNSRFDFRIWNVPPPMGFGDSPTTPIDLTEDTKNDN